MDRIWLSAPDVRGPEREFMTAAIDSNWIAPTGPDLAAFESTLAELGGREHAVGLSSATAAIQLALQVIGVGAGDEVLCPTLTFVATANSIHHAGATPVFIDSDATSWNLDPELLESFLADRSAAGRVPKAVITVDLYGHPCDYTSIQQICDRYGVALIEDSAEALGASHAGKPAGSFGVAGVFSFNGNKLISTSGGGVLVTDDLDLATRVRHLATQARDDAPHYQHTDRGYNFRLSNLLAAFGRGQLVDLDARLARRTEINTAYRNAFKDIPGLTFMPHADNGVCTFWLTALVIDPQQAGFDREHARLTLEAKNIESRPVWKPMHLQPAYADCEAVINGTSDALFADGLCLPSGSGLTERELEFVIETFKELAGAN